MKKQTEVAIKAHIIRGASYLLLLVAGTVMAFLGPQEVTKPLPRTLSFAERVAYQRAIEDVYWRHRIWPKENPGPKPSLDEVMSQEQIKRKVQDYLCNSQLLANEWRRPITPEQLQAEINRMASHTRQRGVLRELFAALGNDPFITAECLARPLLSDRLAREQHAGLHPAISDTPESLAMLAARTETFSMTTDQPASGYYLSQIASSSVEDPAVGCVEGNWTATSTTGAPEGRNLHTALWTGAEMIVWGGGIGPGGTLNTGGKYIPSTDNWVSTTIIDAPEGRERHTAVWTGTEMIVWGGEDASLFRVLNNGGRYNPSTNTWVATTITNAPSRRQFHTTVWTGTEMIVWGGSQDPLAWSGLNNGLTFLNTGGRYNPSTDSWVATPTRGAPEARQAHTGVWSGSEMIIWGGSSLSGRQSTGSRYNPITDRWVATGVTGAPDGRLYHTAVWTGSEMIVWGGEGDIGRLQKTGGKYSPGTDSWIATSTVNAPDARWFHTAVWTGNEMIVWGGANNNGGAFKTGGTYDLSTDSWVATTTIGAPFRRSDPTAVWTGTEMIVWGGNTPDLVYLNTGGRYCVPSDSPTPTPTPTAGPIQLRGQGKKVGGINTSRLKWRGATSANVDVYRDGVVIATTSNDGLYDDSTGTTGQTSFTYQVCEAGPSTCSNNVVVTFPQ